MITPSCPVLVCLFAVTASTLLLEPAAADPMLRKSVNQRGDFLLIGNSAGFDCRAGLERPVVGTVDNGSCGSAESVNDTAPDWL